MSEGHALTFTEHLDELRGRLFACVIALVVATIVCFFFAERALIILAAPLEALNATETAAFIDLTLEADGTLSGQLDPDIEPGIHHIEEMPIRLTMATASGEAVTIQIGERPESRLYYFHLTDPIFLLLKAALLLGLCLSAPMLAWQVWRFVAPGLTAKERRVIRPLIWLFGVLFPIGAAFGYMILHFAVPVLINFAFGGMQLLPDTSKYVSFALTLIIAFGLIFEMPGIFLLLNHLGLISLEWMTKHRSHAIVASFIIAAVITPPDIFTQLAMAIPMLILYELSIWLVRITNPREQA